MNNRQILAALAVFCAVFSGAVLVHSIYRVSPRQSSALGRRWYTTSQRSNQTYSGPMKQGATEIETQAQVGRLSQATKSVQTRVTVQPRAR